ncbi:MAG: PilT/PilU family type 4a pilus ATPase [Planctomycetota bacterium]
MSTFPELPAAPEARSRLEALLTRVVELGASDLHVTAEEPLRVRLDGLLELLPDAAVPSAEETAALAGAATEPAQRAHFARRGTLDLGLSAAGARFRINVFCERGRVALAVRRLDERLRTLEELHLPPALGELADLEEGLVLFVGPTGSGKTTSLATLIERVNAARPLHVLTLEDPIEYVHTSRRALIRQRQLHTDFEDFADALRAALREDPDVILVGEMRDRETLRAALTAAETGHLVFSTLHAANAVAASERFVGAFADEERDSVRAQLSYVLKAVVAQRLLPGTHGGRVPAVELLKVTAAVANLIRSGRPSQVLSALESGGRYGMQTFEESLASLLRRRLVDPHAAQRLARTPELLRERLAPSGGPA